MLMLCMGGGEEGGGGGKRRGTKKGGGMVVGVHDALRLSNSSLRSSARFRSLLVAVCMFLEGARGRV